MTDPSKSGMSALLSGRVRGEVPAGMPINKKDGKIDVLEEMLWHADLANTMDVTVIFITRGSASVRARESPTEPDAGWRRECRW
jgi:hypothetical protein